MGMSTSAKGIRPPDDDFKKMKAAYDACKADGVHPPTEVYKFFGEMPPDPAGVVVDIDQATTEYSAELESGLEVDVTKLPPGVKIIRFTNSW